MSARALRVCGLVLASVLAALLAVGCTQQSLRLALEYQQRADEVQQAVFLRQHEALCILLYRDLLRRLTETGAELTPAQRTAISTAWSERDLIEFWSWQQERARALRIVGVDARLFGEQSTADLLWKYATGQTDRARAALAGEVGRRLSAAVLSGAEGDAEDGDE